MKKFMSTLLAGALLLVPTTGYNSYKYAEVKDENVLEVPFDLETIQTPAYEAVLTPLVMGTEEVPEVEEVEEKYSTFYIVNTPLNKRKTPNTKFKPVGYLAKSEPVEGVDVLDNGWVELKDGSFVNGKYLTVKPGMTEEEYKARKIKFKEERLALAEKQKQQALETQKKKKQHIAKNTTKSTGRSGISITSSERDLLARLVRAEAGGESYEGMVAVASVVFNRVASGKFPNSVNGVVYAKNQFSPVSNGSINRPASEVHYKAVDDALGRDNTNGALFFYAPSLVKSKYMESLKTVAVIGVHHFKVN